MRNRAGSWSAVVSPNGNMSFMGRWLPETDSAFAPTRNCIKYAKPVWYIGESSWDSMGPTGTSDSENCLRKRNRYLSGEVVGVTMSQCKVGGLGPHRSCAPHPSTPTPNNRSATWRNGYLDSTGVWAGGWRQPDVILAASFSSVLGFSFFTSSLSSYERSPP